MKDDSCFQKSFGWIKLSPVPLVLICLKFHLYFLREDHKAATVSLNMKNATSL